MKKLKIALHFIKIKLKNIGSILIKTSAGYAVASFGLIQVASVVTDNLSTESIFGISSESFMQILFIGVLVLFPIVLIISYITRKKTIDGETLKNFDENNSTIDDYRPKIGLIPFENLNKDNERAAIIGGGDGGVARECISKNFNFIDWYELDPEVVDVCNKHLGDIGKKATEKNSVKCVWGDAFESIKSVSDDTYDHIFVDLNDDQFCIDLAAKNMESLVRILKPKGVITAQVGSQDKKPHQVENWLNVFNQNFGNAKLSRVYIPSFDCSWNFSSSINH